MKIRHCQRQRCKHVELEQFLACFRVARVCQRQLGFLVHSLMASTRGHPYKLTESSCCTSWHLQFWQYRWKASNRCYSCVVYLSVCLYVTFMHCPQTADVDTIFFAYDSPMYLQRFLLHTTLWTEQCWAMSPFAKLLRSLFNEHIVNVWNSLPHNNTVDFSTFTVAYVVVYSDLLNAFSF